jgi:hypothetical protein
VSRPLAAARLMTTVAWTSFGAALTCAFLPAPGGTLGTLLIGAVCLVGLRGPSWTARAAGALGAALLVCVGVALAIVRADPSAALAGPGAALASPALRDPATWLPSLAGAALVLGTAPLAGWTAAGLAAAASPDVREPPSPPAARAAGPRMVELAELDRAAAGGHELALALVGIDRGGDEAFAMALLDEALASGLDASDAVCAYGPAERLAVLSGVAAPVLRAGAIQLCAAGTGIAGRPVRAALATLPADGPALRDALDRLERDLALCRAEGAIVAHGGRCA